MCMTGECEMCGTKCFWLICDGKLYGRFCTIDCMVKWMEQEETTALA